MGFVSLPADALRSGYPGISGSVVECMRQGVRQGVRGNCLEYFFEPGEAEYLEFMSYLFHRKDIAI